MTAAVLALALLAAPLESELGVRSEGRAAGAQKDPARAAVLLTGRAALARTTRRLELHLSYEAQGQAGSAQSATLLHSGAASLRLVTPHDAVTLSQSGSVGGRDYSLIAQTGSGATAPPIDQLPAVGVIQMFNSVSSAAWQHTLAPAWSVSTSAGFATGGGLGHDGRAALPLQRTGRAGLSATFAATSRERLTVSADGSLGKSSTGQDARLANLTASWAGAFDARTTYTVGAGVAYIDNPLPVATAGAAAALAPASLQPTARAGLDRADRLAGGPLTLRLTAEAAPAIDPLTGEGYLRGAATLAAAWSPVRELALSLDASGAQALAAAGSDRWAVRTGASVAYRPVRSASFALGGALGWSPLTAVVALPSTPLPPLTGGTQWSVFCVVDLLDRRRI